MEKNVFTQQELETMSNTILSELEKQVKAKFNMPTHLQDCYNPCIDFLKQLNSKICNEMKNDRK